MSHNSAMRNVSIRELHESTGAIVRSVRDEEAVVTDQGHPIALIKPVTPKDLPGKPLPPGHWQSRKRPVIDSDSTLVVADDRDR